MPKRRAAEISGTQRGFRSATSNEPAEDSCQVQLHGLLQEYLDGTLEISNTERPFTDAGTEDEDDGGFRIFGNAPPGMTIKQADNGEAASGGQGTRKPLIPEADKTPNASDTNISAHRPGMFKIDVAMSKRRTPETSSDSEDEETQRRLRSCTAQTTEFLQAPVNVTTTSEEPVEGLKLCQVRLHGLLQEHLSRTLEIISSDEACADAGDVDDEDGGFRLFKRAPPGMTIKQVDHAVAATNGTLSQRNRRPWVHTMKRWKLSTYTKAAAAEFAAVDSEAIIAQCQDTAQKALAGWQLNLAKKEEALKKEQERITLLKATRGEKWLPWLAPEPKSKKKKKASKKKKKADATQNPGDSAV